MGFRGVLFALAALWAASAHADGMIWLEKTAVDAGFESADVLPDAQRAIFQFVPEDPLGLDGTWELTIQPRFLRPKAGAVWVVPFPVCPEVREADSSFLDELDLLTEPVFVEGCVQDCQCPQKGGCFFAGAAEGDGRSSVVLDPRGAPDVAVWQAGNLGPLDFVVLSAESGGDVVQWLGENGYVIEPGVESFVLSGENEGLCYFVARLPEPAVDDEVLPAVTFGLKGLSDPVYPLRLTRLGMSGETSTLAVKLWFVVPKEPLLDLPTRSVNVATHLWGIPSCLQSEETTMESLETCMDEFWTGDHEGGLALTFAAGISDRAASASSRDELCHSSFSPLASSGNCLQLSQLFGTAPEEWTEETRSLSPDPHHVTRYEGKLTASAMEEDLVFVGGVTSGYWLTPCQHDNHCKGFFSGYLKGGMKGTAYHGICRDLGGHDRCTSYCLDQADCPSGWSCSFIENVYADPDGAVRACIPPKDFAIPEEMKTADELDYIVPVFTKIVEGCDLDCTDVCTGNLDAGAYLLSVTEAPALPGTTALPVLFPLALWAALRFFYRRRQRA